MACIKRTFMPENGQQLGESIKECAKEGLMPILQAGVQVKGRSLLDAKELKGKEVAFINVEKLEKKKSDEQIPKSCEKDLKELGCQKALLERLQKKVGCKPIFEIELFENWAGNKKSCVISCCPESKEEISSVIKAAAEENVGIRCAGAGHSWAPVFADSGQICVYTKNVKSDYPSQANIRVADVDTGTVDVMTGVTTGELKNFQLQKKLSLKANVILDTVQIVSVAQTGCHGVGKDTSCLSDYLVKMRVFDSNGELQTYTADDNAKCKFFKAASAGFGCFGIVYDVTLKMDPEIIVETKTEYLDMNATFNSEEKLKCIIEKNWAAQIFWFPFNSFSCDLEDDKIWLRIFNKHSLEGTDQLENDEFYKTKAVYDLISQLALKIVSSYITNDESIVPSFQWLSFKTITEILYPAGSIYQELPHAIHFRKYLDFAEVYDMEFVFDYKGDYTTLKKIIQCVVTTVKDFKEEKHYPLNISLEMRFMKHSDAYLGTGSIAAPQYEGSGHVVCIEVLCLKGTPYWREFFTEVGRKWMAPEFCGVPHLAKQYDFLPDIFSHIKEKMKTQIEDFKKCPISALFLNKGMRQILGCDEPCNEPCISSVATA